MKPHCVFASLMFGLGASGCMQAPKASLFGQPREIFEEDYSKVLKTWTRSDKVYQGLENKLFITATFHSPEFRRAFAVAFPHVYGSGGKITRRELVDLNDGVEQHHNFFISFYTPDRRWNDVDESDSIWRLTIENDEGVAVNADEIVRVKVDENLRAVYPHISSFDRLYLVRFPLVDALEQVLLTPESTGVIVRVASALGVAELEWELVPGTESKVD